MSETIKYTACQDSPQTASLFVFIRKNTPKNQRSRIIIRLKALMKSYENKSNQGINLSQTLKMNKHTKKQSLKKPFCPKPKVKYSFDTPKLFVRISQTFVRVLSEKNDSRTKFRTLSDKMPLILSETRTKRQIFENNS